MFRPALIRLLVLVSAVTLGVGLIGPAMTIETGFGRFDGWIRLFEPGAIREQHMTYALLGGILTLIDRGELLIGGILLAFSAVFPTLKLALLAAGNETLARGGRSGVLLRLAGHAGKFSMLDVTVAAFLVLAIKGLPGRSELRLEWGLYAFAASVLLSLAASLLLPRRGGGRVAA